MRTLTRVIGALLVVVSLAVTYVPVPTGFAERSLRHTEAISLSLTPNPARLHRRLTVKVTGVHPGTRLSFVISRIPDTADFGGQMGTFRANSRGIIQFSYPLFFYETEIGWWKVIAYRTEGSVVLKSLFRVAP